MFVFLALGSQRLHMQTSISACSAGMARAPHKVKHKLQTLLGSLAIICLSEQYKKKKRNKQNVETRYKAAFKSNLDGSVEPCCNKR